MKKIFLFLSILLFLGVTNGCISDKKAFEEIFNPDPDPDPNLDDYPPIRYAVAFKYTNHIGKENRFHNDVKKINLYVFDKNNLVYHTTTELSPYEKNFNIPLDLPVGKYHIVAWGNVWYDQFSVTPNSFVKGVTTLAEARLILEKTSRNNLNDTELEKLFYGELPNVEIPHSANFINPSSRIDTISLVNNTEHIRVVLHWDDTKYPSGIDPSNVVVHLKGSNAAYRFNNERVAADVIYAPYKTYLSDYIVDSIITNDKRDWLKINYYPNNFEKKTKSSIYEFSVLRLFKDIPLNLVVEYHAPTNEITNLASVDIISRTTGFEYLFINRGISESQWQRTFDINELYRVDMYIQALF